MEKNPTKHEIVTSEELPVVLIAGGAGFIGSHLCQLLLSQNCQVFCLDNLATGKKENIEPLLKEKNFNFVEHDLTKSLDRVKLPSFDYVFHLAGIESYLINGGQPTDFKTLMVNSLGTRNLLELVKEQKSRFLLGSTPHVFEALISTKELENYFGKKEDGRSFYTLAEAKRFSESLVFEYFKNYDLDCRIVRILDAYGPRMPLNTSSEIAGLFKDLKEGEMLRVPGEGTKVVYPTFIEDSVYGLLKAMFNQASTGKIYTLADSQEITLLKLAHVLRKISDFQIGVEFVASRVQQVPVEKKELLKSQKELNWYPKVKLEEGIKKTLEWLKTAKGKEEKTEEDKKPAITQEEPTKEKETAKLEEKKEPEGKKEREFTVLEKVMQAAEPAASSASEVEEKEEPIAAEATAEETPAEEVQPKEEKEKIEKEEEKKEKGKVKEVKEEKPKRVSLLTKILKKKKTKSLAEPKEKNVYKKILVFLLILVLLIFSFPLLSATYYFKRGISQMEKNKTSSALLSFEKSKRVLIEFSWLTSLPGLKKPRDEALSFLTLGIHVLEAESKKIEAIKHFNNLIGIVFQEKKGDPEQEVKKTRLYLDQVYQDLSLVESELNRADFKAKKFVFLAKLKDELESFKKEVPDLRKKVNLSREGLKIFPEILAFEDKKTYLILLQDNMELRPTGGFISSFAFLTFEQGKLLDFEIKDVYSADSQLKGHVDPPEPIKKYLGEVNWYLRDSNWDPDFPTAAARAEWFLVKEIGRSTDGTMALTLSFIQEVLSNLGPVQLPDYDEIIKADNIFERAVYYSEINFSPGLGKKDFLSQLTGLLFEKIKKMPSEDWLRLGEAVEKGLKKKQLLISFSDRRAKHFFAQNGWDGVIRQQALDKDKAGLGDYLMLVEANLGVNKANFFLKRELKQEVTILEEGELIETLTIKYENTSDSQGWPGGDYKNYLRVYTPPKSRLVGIEIGEDSSSLISLKETKIDSFKEHGKQVFGFLLTVPVKEKRLVKITYQPKDKINFKDNLASYLFFWQKQPGIDDDNLELQVNFPSSLEPIEIAPKAKLEGHQVIFSSNASQDNIFLIEFKK